jgi:LPS O-antigen subunit length determinant protein (WzzB/FepE family)
VEDLENEMQLKYEIYQQVSEHLHLAKAKVQERTPAFTIVQGASVPVKHSSRSKVSSLVIWMMLGFMLRTCILLWKNRRQFINI